MSSSKLSHWRRSLSGVTTHLIRRAAIETVCGKSTLRMGPVVSEETLVSSSMYTVCTACAKLGTSKGYLIIS